MVVYAASTGRNLLSVIYAKVGACSGKCPATMLNRASKEATVLGMHERKVLWLLMVAPCHDPALELFHVRAHR